MSQQDPDGPPSPPSATPGARFGDTEPRTWSDRVFWVLLLAAAAVRIPGCFTELWFDEVAYLWVAHQGTESLIELFTIGQDWVNQHLHTMILYALGEQDHWPVYRIHALMAGVGTVILAWLIAVRSGRDAAIIASLLTGGSYLLIHYSSEARGYSLVVFFALASWYTLQRFADRLRWRWVALFWLSACLGFLSHLMYIHVLLAACVWLAHHLARSSRSRLEFAARCAQCLAVPSLFLAMFWVFVVRHLEQYGSGGESAAGFVLIRSLSYAVGGPGAGPVAYVAAVPAACLFVAATIFLWRSRSNEWSFYCVVLFVSPSLLFLVKPPDLFVVRYFLVQVAFGLIAASILAAHLLRGGRTAKSAVIVVVLLLLAGNAVNVTRFLRVGRGGYLQGLRYMARHTPGNVVTVTSDSDTRNGYVVDYYTRFVPEKRIVYFNREDYPATGPMWRISHRFIDIGDIPVKFFDQHGNQFELAKTIPFFDLSGMNWYLYKNRRLLP